VNSCAAVSSDWVSAKACRYQRLYVRYLRRSFRRGKNRSFPVEPGLTSHEARLAVVRRCHGIALRIGTRSGGEYLSYGKSITWREWEEACLPGLAPIVLVNRKTNGLCGMIAKERSVLKKAAAVSIISRNRIAPAAQTFDTVVSLIYMECRGCKNE
jgi:hypothetical protein